jgi:hypothetical protein
MRRKEKRSFFFLASGKKEQFLPVRRLKNLDDFVALKGFL